MRTSTSFAILTLLATAGQTFGAPITARDSPATINNASPFAFGKEPVVAINTKPISGVGLVQPKKVLIGDKNAIDHQDPNFKGDKVTLFPETTTSGKDGVANGNTDQGLHAHVIQTPGKDTTLATAQVVDGNKKEKVDVNVPSTGGLVDTHGLGTGKVFGTDLKNEEGVVGLGPDDSKGNVVGQVLGGDDKGRGKQLIGVPPIVEVSGLSLVLGQVLGN
jgi:hypothetical protein